MKLFGKSLIVLSAILMLSAAGNDDMDPRCSMVKILALMCGGLLAGLMGAMACVYDAQKKHTDDPKTAREEE